MKIAATPIQTPRPRPATAATPNPHLDTVTFNSQENCYLYSYRQVSRDGSFTYSAGEKKVFKHNPAQAGILAATTTGAPMTIIATHFLPAAGPLLGIAVGAGLGIAVAAWASSDNHRIDRAAQAAGYQPPAQ